jgi:RNA polymerase sigma-70 factor (ECF subfamily)
MIHLTKTTTALLDALMDSQDQQVWAELDNRYRPIIRGLARKLGLTYTDAEDVVQEVLSRFVKHYRAGEYDRGRGRLRAWIIQIARHCIADVHRSKSMNQANGGDSAIAGLSSDDEFAQLWDEEYRAFILESALSELRAGTRIDERTIRAFEKIGLCGEPVATVAAELGMSADSVYAAKSRCLKELREIVLRLNIVYEIG